MQSKPGRWMYLLGGFFVCLALAALGFFYLDYTTARAMPTIPLVRITEIYPESPVAADQSVVVFGQASDPDGIAEVQWLVNGQMVASQRNPDPGSDQPFESSQAWIPTGAANYLIQLRAIDTKGSSGQSDPVMIEAVERLYAPGPSDPAPVETATPSAGGSSGSGGDSGAPPAGDGGGAPPAGDGADEPPRVDPPGEAPPPAGDATPAEPASPPLWLNLPLPDNFVCLIYPSVCFDPASIDPSSPPINVSAAMNDSCQVLVEWQDTSENETGFRLYRVARRPFHFDRIALLQASPGSGGRLSYLDERLPNQEYFYFVAAYNGRGEFWSAPSDLISSSCTPTEGLEPRWDYAIEALDMTVRDPYDRMYCYVSLAGSPFERIPADSSFLELESGSWNIADHFAGRNKRILQLLTTSPLEIKAECLGWRGSNLVNLGQFSRTHPVAEWDGRPLTASPPDGSFVVTYRILPVRETTDETGEVTWWQIIDPNVPSPYNLNEVDHWWNCDDDDGLSTCSSVREPGLAWDYPRSPEFPPTNYRVYVRRSDETFWRLHYTSPPGFLYAPQAAEDCHVSIFYAVSAVVGVDPTSGEVIESNLSPALEIPATCAEMEVTLISLWSYRAQDHITCNIFQCVYWDQAYGWLNFNGQRVRWNINCDGINFGGGNCSRIPHTTDIQEHTTMVYWENEYLNTGSGWAKNNNVFRVPVEDGLGLRVTFSFSDHDDNDADDFWCGTSSGRSYAQVLEPRSLAEWQTVDQDIVLADDQLGVHSPYKNCEIRFHVRGIP